VPLDQASWQSTVDQMLTPTGGLDQRAYDCLCLWLAGDAVVIGRPVHEPYTHVL
jgi:hypothetical protein